MIVEIQTSLGTVRVEVLSDAAPKATEWFLSLVDQKIFDGTQFYRAGHLAGQVNRPRFLEGGALSPFLLAETAGRPTTVAETGLPQFSEWERTDQTGLRHVRGSVSLARDIVGDGRAAPDLFIALEPIPEMDAGGGYSPQNTGFPIIGQVIEGMDLVDAIAASPRTGETYIPLLTGQILNEPVRIDRIVRIPVDGAA